MKQIIVEKTIQNHDGGQDIIWSIYENGKLHTSGQTEKNLKDTLDWFKLTPTEIINKKEITVDGKITGSGWIW